MNAVLNVIKKLSKRIDEEIEKVKYLRNLMSSVTQELDGMPKSPNVSKKVEWLAVKIVDIESEISTLKAILITCRIELLQWLEEKFSGGTCGQILFYRYGLLKKFSEIADELHFSEQYVFKLHRIGVKMLKVNSIE